ncbi:hypothetical protein HDF11_004761 [Tunturiibacter psychrotolerans]
MIDHVFMFVKANGPEVDQMASLGLVETSRRTHRGQHPKRLLLFWQFVS